MSVSCLVVVGGVACVGVMRRELMVGVKSGGDLASLRRLLDKRSARRQINVRVVVVIVVRECVVVE